MNIKLYSKWGELPLAENFPNAPSNLLMPGARCKVATRPDNRFYYLFQEFETSAATIRCCNFFSSEKDSVTVVTDPTVTFRFATYRSHKFIVKYLNTQIFHERSYNCFYNPHISAEYPLEPGETFAFIDILANDTYLQSFEDEFTEPQKSFLSDVILKLPAKLIHSNQVAPIEVLRWIDDLVLLMQGSGENIDNGEKYTHQLIKQSIANIGRHSIRSHLTLNQLEVDKIYKAGEVLRTSNKDYTKKEIHHLAQLVGLSVYKLQAGFQQIYGHSILKHQSEEKMRWALRLVDDKLYSEKVVAGMLGFSSQQSFSRKFKKRFGYPPYRF